MSFTPFPQSSVAFTALAPLFEAGKPLWILCAGALLCVLVDALAPRKAGALVYLAGLLACGAALVVALAGPWDAAAAPLAQNLLVIDRLTRVFLVIILVIGMLSLVNMLGSLRGHHDSAGHPPGELASLTLFSLTGMAFLFASDNLIVNFVALEMLSLSIYVLVGSSKDDARSNEAAVKYFVLGGVASAILLYGIALFYGSFGTFSLSDAALSSAPRIDTLYMLGLAFMLVGVFFKLGIVPFHFWAPDVYQGAPSAVTGFMAAGVKAAAFGFALRLFMGLGVLSIPKIEVLLRVVAIATIFVGAVAALVQRDIKRLLAYSSISHAGFLMLGVAAGFHDGRYDASGAGPVIFYLFAYLFMALGAFAVLAALQGDRGEVSALADLAGLGKKHPVLAGVLSLFLLSLLGLPGTAGFSAKYGVIGLAITNDHVGLAIIAVLLSVVSAAYYLKPIAIMFFRDPAGDVKAADGSEWLLVSIAACTAFVISLGLAPSTVAQLATLVVPNLK